MKRLILLTALLLPFTSFSVLADEPKLYSVSNENIPTIGEVLTLYMGDKMMVQRTGRYLPCYKANVRQEVQSKQHVIIEKDALFCREAPDSKHYLA